MPCKSANVIQVVHNMQCCAYCEFCSAGVCVQCTIELKDRSNVLKKKEKKVGAEYLEFLGSLMYNVQFISSFVFILNMFTEHY